MPPPCPCVLKPLPSPRTCSCPTASSLSMHHSNIPNNSKTTSLPIARTSPGLDRFTHIIVHTPGLQPRWGASPLPSTCRRGWKKGMVMAANIAIQVGQQAGLPAPEAHQPGPRSIHSHPDRYRRPVVPAGGLSAALRLQCGVGKGNMTNFGCMGLWWYRPAWAGQTAVGGAKGGPGPPSDVKGQLRWAVVRVYEGGAQHTHLGRCGWPCMVVGWVVGMKGRWWDGGRTSGRSPAWSSIPSPRPVVRTSPGGARAQHLAGAKEICDSA